MNKTQKQKFKTKSNIFKKRKITLLIAINFFQNYLMNLFKNFMRCYFLTWYKMR